MDQDLKISLDAHAARLGGVTFQARLGSYADKTLRVKALAQAIGGRIGAGPLVERAAALSKADLMTAMVGEFPELQGTMGRYYAAAQGEPEELALALEEHYLPRYAGDSLPTTKTGQAVALADKIDTLVGIFAIEQRPTGAKDPFGLRRAALGLLRILTEGRLNWICSNCWAKPRPRSRCSGRAWSMRFTTSSPSGCAATCWRRRAPRLKCSMRCSPIVRARRSTP